MAIPTPQQTIIDPNGDNAITKSSIELATANGGISVFETTKDIYVTAVEENYTTQYVTNQDVTQVNQDVVNNPSGVNNGEVQYIYNGAFSSDGTNFLYNNASSTLNVQNLAVAGNANLGNVANVKINNGTNGQVLATDGAGNLSWITPASNSPSSTSNGNSNVSVLSNGVVTISANGQANIIRVSSTGTTATTNIANTVNVSGDFSVGSNTSNAYINSANVAFYDALVTLATGQNGTNPPGTSDNRQYRGLLINYPTGASTATNAWFGINTSNSLNRFYELGIDVDSVSTPNVVSVTTYGNLKLNTVTGNLIGNVTNSLFSNVKFAANSKAIGISAPTSISANYNLTLPASQGAAGYALTNDGTGNLSWTAVPGANSFVSNSITGNGTVDFTGATNISFPTLSNVHIPGGSNGYVLKTDGTGGLSWVAQAGTPSNIINGSSNIQVIANANITLSANGVSNIVVVSSDVSIGTASSPGIKVPYISVNSSGVGQFSEFVGDSNEAVYFYLQNYNSGANATSDISISSDLGTDTQGYIDMGIASSTYGNGGNTGFANIVKPQDSYLISVGNTTAGGSYSPGNLVIGAFTDGNSRVKIGAGAAGYNASDILMTLGNGLVNVSGTTTTISSGNLVSNSNVSFTGSNVSLGAVGNVKITGGANGQILTTNGSGTLSWSVPTFTYALENFTANNNAPTGVINFDILSNAIVLNTTNASGNVTLNFRGNGSATLDSILATGQTVTATYIVNTGINLYGVTAVRADGVGQTVKWFGGSAPVVSANSTTAYTFTIMKTGSAAYTILGSAGRYA